MKRSAKQNAITNSPLVRALIQPVMRKIVLPSTAPAPVQEAAPPPPSAAHLISTQPSTKAVEPVASTSQVGMGSPTGEMGKGKKRAREEDERPVGKVDRRDKEVSFTRRNLPQELNKCQSLLQAYLLLRPPSAQLPADLPPPPLPRSPARSQTGPSATAYSLSSTAAFSSTSKAGTPSHPS